MAKQKDADYEADDEPMLDDPEALNDDEVDFAGIDLDDDPDSLRQERDQLKDRLLRALAETENLRKRAERDRRDAELYGGVKLARDLLSVYDNLGRALDAIDDELREKSAALVEGIELTQQDLLATFAKHKIEKLEPELGEKFDPKLHQAMFEAPIGGQPAGSIIQVLSNGFVIGERLLRPANVGVSSGGGAARAPDESPEDA